MEVYVLTKFNKNDIFDEVLNPHVLSVQTTIKRAASVAEDNIAQEADPDDEIPDSAFNLEWKLNGGVSSAEFKDDRFDVVYMISSHIVTET
jgi:hypothetical protein